MGWNRIVQATVGRWFQIFYAFLSWFGRHMVKPPSVQYLDWLQPPTFGRKLRACRRWLQSILQVQLRCWRPIKGPKGGGHLRFFSRMVVNPYAGMTGSGCGWFGCSRGNVGGHGSGFDGHRWGLWNWVYPMVNCPITMEHHHFVEWVNQHNQLFGLGHFQ